MRSEFLDGAIALLAFVDVAKTWFVSPSGMATGFAWGRALSPEASS